MRFCVLWGPGVAPKHDTAKYWGYTSQWNMLDYPVFPVGYVDKNRDGMPNQLQPLSGKDEENWALCKSFCQIELDLLTGVDDVDEFHGLPISLQLVGRRFEDEKVLAILGYILSNHK
jgi:amidase